MGPVDRQIWSIYCKYKFTHKGRKIGWIILVCCIFEECHILCLFDRTKLALVHVIYLRNCDVYCNTELILKHWQYTMYIICLYVKMNWRCYVKNPVGKIRLYWFVVWY